MYAITGANSTSFSATLSIVPNHIYTVTMSASASVDAVDNQTRDFVASIDPTFTVDDSAYTIEYSPNLIDTTLVSRHPLAINRAGTRTIITTYGNNRPRWTRHTNRTVIGVSTLHNLPLCELAFGQRAPTC